MRQDCARWLVAMTLLMSGCDNSAPNAHTSTAPTPGWPSDSPLPKGKLNAGSTVTINATTESPAQVLSPATSGNSLYRPLNHAVAPGDQVSGKVTLSSDTPLQVRLFLARNDQSSWEASQQDVTIGPTPTTHTISHTFKSPHQDARLQIALQSDADTLMVHDAAVQLIPSSSCDWQVIAVSTLPDPETADYPDCLDVLHLKRSDSCDEPQEALVAVQTMTDRTLTSSANIKLGDLLTINTLTPWNETPNSIRSIRTVQDMDEFHLPMFFGDGSKVVGKQSATAYTSRPIAKVDAGEFLAPAPSEDQKQWIANDLETIQQIAVEHGGWQTWADSLDGFRGDLRRLVSDKVTLIGDDWLASKNRANWLQESRKCSQSNDEMIYPKATETIIDTAAKLNACGIDLIVIPVPPRAEVMPEKFGGDPTQLVAPHRYRFMHQLLTSGIEVIDVLPAMLAAKEGESREDPVVFAADPHWASRGLYAAATAVAPRLERYRTANSFDAPIRELGSAVEDTAILKEASDEMKMNWMKANVSTRIAEPATHDHPLLIVTDSYGGTHEKVKGDFTRHASALSGASIQRISEGGAGPRTPSILARNSAEALDDRPAVLWLFVASYLPDRHGWKTPNWPPKMSLKSNPK